MAHFGHHLVSALLTPLSPFIRDNFALDYAQIGWLASAFALSYGVSQLPAGWLADRIGPRAVLTIGISGVAVAGVLVGLSPTYVMLIVFLILLGITGGGYHPASAPLVSALVEPSKRGRALGIHQIGGSVSHFLAPIVAVAIATAPAFINFSWRASFIVLSIPIFILGIVFYILLGRRGYTRKAKQGISEGHTETARTPGHWRRMVAFLVLGIVGQVLIFAVISFIPLFLVDSFGVSEGMAAGLLTLAYFGGLLAGPLGGYLSDRFGEVPVTLLVTFIVGPVIYLLGTMSYNWGIFVVLLLIGTLCFIRMPVSESYIIGRASVRERSTMLGIYYFGSRGGSGVITPALGYLIDQVGFQTSFTIVGAAIVALTLVCSIFLWGDRRSISTELHQ